MKTTWIFIVLFIFSFGASAQKNYAKDADKAFDQKEFFSSIELYKKALSKTRSKEEKARITFRIAECYRMTGEARQQESWYTKAIKVKYADPVAILYLAEAKKSLSKYDEALIEYQNYAKEVPSNEAGNIGIRSCEMAQKWKDSPTRYKVENVAQINTRQSDFAPAYADKKCLTLYITSTREGCTGGVVDNGLGQAFSDIFETKVDRLGKWSTPVPVASVSTRYNEGSANLSRKMNTMFFTRCGVEKNKEARCQLYVASRQGNSWGKEALVPFCTDSFTFGHPSLSADEQTLYFSSDMPGGFGGKDIWVSTYDKKAKRFGAPVNAGHGVNSQGDEMYPFIAEDGTLYFSSNGLIGMGGLDIYKGVKKGQKWEVSNMQSPINSAGDDFGIIFEGRKEKGYFSSNREGGKGGDDIYSFVMPPLIFLVDGIITDCKNTIPLENVRVALTGSDGMNVETRTDKNGYYRFAEIGNARYINPNTSYVIVAYGEGVSSRYSEKYFNAKEKAKFSTIGELESRNYKEDLCLPPADGIIRFPAVQYALESAALTQESKDSLNFLYQTLIDNPTITIELSSHTDSRASDAHNDKLSQARAQSCVDYLIREKGIPAERLRPKGYGKHKLLITDKEIAAMATPEEKEAGHQKNRRTVFRVLSWNYSDPYSPKAPPIVPPKVIGEEQGYTESPEDGD